MVYEETTGSVAQEKLQVCVVVNSVLSNSLLLWELQVFHLQQQIIHMLNCTFACPPEMKSPREVCSFLLSDPAEMHMSL